MTIKVPIPVEQPLPYNQYKECTIAGVNGHSAMHQSYVEPQSEAGRWVSEADYWADYYDRSDFHYEWNNGILEEKPVPDFAQVLVYDWFQALLRWYLEVNPIAKMIFLEMGFRLATAHHTSVRKPDLFLIRHDNPVLLDDDDYAYPGIADLCVESISDSGKKEIERDTKTKKGEYQGVGVHEYYILDARKRYTTFYRRNATGDYAPIQPDANGVIASTVLPGFRFRITDLYRRPSILEMAAAPVYQHFVMVDYQVEHQRAEQERQRAEQAEAAAKQEQARAERLAAKLRALGIEEN